MPKRWTGVDMTEAVEHAKRAGSRLKILAEHSASPGMGGAYLKVAGSVSAKKAARLAARAAERTAPRD